MTTRRLGLDQLMALIVILSASMAAMKVASEGLERAVASSFLLAVLVGTLGATARRDRGAWLGFAMFGWAYALVAFAPPIQSALASRLPTEEWAYGLVTRWIHPETAEPANPLPFKAVRGPDGYYKYDANGMPSRFAPTPDEAKSIDVFNDQQDAGKVRLETAGHAVRIAYAFVGLAFAFIGAALGRVLERPGRPGPTPASGPSGG